MAESARDREAVRALQQRNADVRRTSLHRQWRLGLTDTEIARALGVGRRTVTALREEMGLPPNRLGDR